ncbi:MAG: hypothetical protein ABR499_03570 [Gemmatimonadaceae bacterium]
MTERAMSTVSAERHRSDGELIGLLDGEAGIGAADVAAHVDTCPVCSARLALLQQRAARLSAVLRLTEPPPADRTRLLPAPDRLARAGDRARRRAIWWHPGLRAAAGILLVAGVAAASPARGWILDRVTGRRNELTPSTPGATGSGPARAPEQSAGSIVSFTGSSDELLIRFDARPAAGSLAVVAGEEPRSSAQIVSGGRGEAFLVLPSELRVRNAAGSVADYELTVAQAVRRVRVQLGGSNTREIAIVDVTPGMRRIIQLGSAERRR